MRRRRTIWLVAGSIGVCFLLGLLFLPWEESKEEMKRSQDLSNINRASRALTLYAEDHNDSLPPVKSTADCEALLNRYLVQTGRLSGDEAARIWKPLLPGTRLLYNLACGGRKLSSIRRPDIALTFVEDRTWPDGKRCVGFLSGHSKKITQEEFEPYNVTWTSDGFRSRRGF